MSAARRPGHVVDDVVVGARRVRAAVDGALDSPGPVRLLVTGPRGAAKSAVLRRLSDAAADAGRPVTRLVTGGDPDAVPADTILVVDDLPSLDDDTLVALERRAADPTASLVATLRPAAGSGRAARIAARLEATRPALVLGQVTRADVLDHCGDELAASCVDWVLATTEGVSWLVAAALAAHDDRDCADDPLHLELDRLLAGVIAHRLAAVDDDVRVSVEHASSGLGAPAPADALRRAHAEGLLLRDGRAVPAVRSAVASGLAPQSIADRAGAAFDAGDLDAAAFLVDLARTEPGAAGAAELATLAASIWSARGMLAVGHEQYKADAEGHDVGADIAALGSGVAPGPAAPASATSAASTARVADELLREGLRASLVADRAAAATAMLVRASQLSTASRRATPLPELPAVIAAAAAQSRGDLPAARAVIDAAIAGGQGGRSTRARLLLWRAWLAMHQVRSAEAREQLAAATAAAPVFTPRDELLAHAVRLGLARRHGDAAALETAWEAARPVLASIDVDLFLIQPLTEFIASAAKLHDTVITDAATAQVLELLGRLGDPRLWATPLRWAAVQRAILVNDPESLAPHAHALSAAAALDPVAATMASAGKLWTVVLGGTIDADDVDSAASALADLGLTWDGARLAGTAAGLADDRRVSARLLSRAREIHPPDAARLVPRAQPEVLGPRAVPQPSAPSVLSRREIDVARLVIEGKTYAEVGAAIFISPRTAEHHIASIRRRLGATSRSDLIAKLKDALASGGDGIRAVA